MGFIEARKAEERNFDCDFFDEDCFYEDRLWQVKKRTRYSDKDTIADLLDRYGFGIEAM